VLNEETNLKRSGDSVLRVDSSVDLTGATELRKMQNTDVFKAFDMVVSVPEYVINSQIELLSRLGIVPDRLRIYQDSRRSYKVVENNEPIPTQKPYLSGDLTPRIRIDESGNHVVFLLNLSEVDFAYWDGAGPDAEFVVKKFENLCYALSVCFCSLLFILILLSIILIFLSVRDCMLIDCLGQIRLMEILAGSEDENP
jgi:hypothetical protein